MWDGTTQSMYRRRPDGQTIPARVLRGDDAGTVCALGRSAPASASGERSCAARSPWSRAASPSAVCSPRHCTSRALEPRRRQSRFRAHRSLVGTGYGRPRVILAVDRVSPARAAPRAPRSGGSTPAVIARPVILRAVHGRVPDDGARVAQIAIAPLVVGDDDEDVEAESSRAPRCSARSSARCRAGCTRPSTVAAPAAGLPRSPRRCAGRSSTAVRVGSSGARAPRPRPCSRRRAHWA